MTLARTLYRTRAAALVRAARDSRHCARIHPLHAPAYMARALALMEEARQLRAAFV